MAIMAMATVRKINNFHSANVIVLLSWFVISSSAIAREWQFIPNFGIEETYTDNVELTITDPTSSLVSQAIFGLDVDYQSRVASFSFSGKNNNLFFSHDSDINDSYLALDTAGQYYLWTSGPALFASANVSNTNRSNADNSLADLVSGGTIQSEAYTTGILYNVNNSSFSIESSLAYSINRYEDGIGEYNGVSAILNSSNSNNARITFWELSSDFSTRSQDFSGETRTGDQYRVDAKLGLITSLNLNPFIRFYDEDYSGNFGNQNQPTTSSWGPGMRWLVSPHLTVDLSYNYVFDDAVSDDYIATSIQWEPSARTSLTAGYSQRFFGDSYNLAIQHRTKRLTNSISYDESLEIFDRNNYEQVGSGGGSLEPVESNEFSLNKRFAWTSKLQLARTSFAINTSASRREGLESKVIDDTLVAALTIDRKISGKSKLTFLVKYDYLIFDKSNPEGSRQEDHYRTVSATYTKNLASSLSTHFTLQHVNRDSNIDQYSYDEVRAIINVTKEF